MILKLLHTMHRGTSKAKKEHLRERDGFRVSRKHTFMEILLKSTMLGFITTGISSSHPALVSGGSTLAPRSTHTRHALHAQVQQRLLENHVLAEERPSLDCSSGFFHGFACVSLCTDVFLGVLRCRRGSFEEVFQ